MIDQPRDFFHSISIDGTKLEPKENNVLSIKHIEEVSKPFFAEVIFSHSELINQKKEDILGKDVNITIFLKHDNAKEVKEKVKYISGIITSTKSQITKDFSKTTILQIGPKVYCLYNKMPEHPRIFSDIGDDIKQNTLKICKMFLETFEIKHDLHSSVKEDDCLKLDNYFQYTNQSDLSVVNHLLHEDEIDYTFKHDDKEHTMLLYKDNISDAPEEGDQLIEMVHMYAGSDAQQADAKYHFFSVDVDKIVETDETLNKSSVRNIATIHTDVCGPLKIGQKVKLKGDAVEEYKSDEYITYIIDTSYNATNAIIRQKIIAQKK